MPHHQKSSRQISYFRIGTFIISGAALLIVAILLLSSGRLFRKIVYIETYFNESVQGLVVGSPVKYRGLSIGRVKKVTFVNLIYKTKHNLNTNKYNRYIYVEMEVTPSFLKDIKPENREEFIEKSIKDGLRVQLTQQGLTGNTYLELNFLNPKNNSPLPIDWTPKHYYIPSAISALTNFSDNAQHILDNLKKVEFKKTFSSIEKLANTTNKVMQETNDLLHRTDENITNTLNNLSDASTNLRAITENTKSFPSSVIFGSPPPKLNPEDL